MGLYYYQLLTLAAAAAAIAMGAAPPPKRAGTAEQRAFEAKSDKKNLSHSPRVVTDTSEALLAVPHDYPGARDFDLAHTPPAVDFSILQGLQPEFDPEGARSRLSLGGWGDVTRGPDGCFYFAIGNHMSYDGGNAYLIRYDPARKAQSIVFDTRSVAGWKMDDCADGKIHGDPDIGPNGELWALTWFGPVPTPKDFDAGYRGSTLIHANVLKGTAEALGVPLEGEGFPYHSWDWQRGTLFAAGHYGQVLVYDTRARRMVYGGAPPNGILWANRAILLDRETGIFYGSEDSPKSQNYGRLLRYERRNNSFDLLKSSVPINPVTGKASRLRAYSREKDPQGGFWCSDAQGTLFRFFPSEDRVEPVGVNWDKRGMYVTNMAMSPGGRYLYYVLESGADYGTPVIQFNTTTRRKKVIAFLRNYYLERYGYLIPGAYGVELDARGESLFFYVNGSFTDGSRVGARRPATLHVRIPPSER